MRAYLYHFLRRWIYWAHQLLHRHGAGLGPLGRGWPGGTVFPPWCRGGRDTWPITRPCGVCIVVISARLEIFSCSRSQSDRCRGQPPTWSTKMKQSVLCDVASAVDVCTMVKNSSARSRDGETTPCLFSTARAQADQRPHVSSQVRTEGRRFRHGTNEVSSRCRIRSAGRSLVVAFQERAPPCSTAISALQLFSRNVKKNPHTWIRKSLLPRRRVEGLGRRQ